MGMRQELEAMRHQFRSHDHALATQQEHIEHHSRQLEEVAAAIAKVFTESA